MSTVAPSPAASAESPPERAGAGPARPSVERTKAPPIIATTPIAKANDAFTLPDRSAP